MTARVLVHADGGACHGTPIVDGRCPKCGIAPDTQSLELWPQPAERRPCAGWAPIFDAYHLPGTIECLANEDDNGDGYIWALRADTSEGRLILIAGDQQVYGTAPTIDAAMIAAEDALQAIAAEILRAVGA